jgi:NADPH:quinone reductase-like Zn-dependent oxidoreductase
MHPIALRHVRGAGAAGRLSAMRQIWITRPGPPRVLAVEEAPDPEAKPGHVRVRVRACGVNFADLLARVGLYPDAPKPPCVVGYEVSGTIDQVGQGVTGLAPGDRVLALCKFGGYSDLVVVPTDQVIPMPAAMTFEQGAAFPVVYLTAYNMMLFNGNLRPNSTVLVHSAAGGVGVAAIQIARTRGCTILGTASPSKHAFLREQGCQHPIDSSGDYAAQARAIVGEKGIDLVLDPVGGRSWTEGYELLAPCGRLVAFGLSAASRGNTRHLLHALRQLLSVKKWSPMKLMDDNKTIAGTNLGHLFARPDLIAPQLVALMRMYQEGQLAPHVDRAFPFTEAPAAHQHIHDRKSVGKVLLVP